MYVTVRWIAVRYTGPDVKPLTRSKTMKNQTPALSDAKLDTVTGGKGYSQLMALLTSLQQLQHDTAKGVIQNMRA
jgi:hypothetical protein